MRQRSLLSKADLKQTGPVVPSDGTFLHHNQLSIKVHEIVGVLSSSTEEFFFFLFVRMQIDTVDGVEIKINLSFL